MTNMIILTVLPVRLILLLVVCQDILGRGSHVCAFTTIIINEGVILSSSSSSSSRIRRKQPLFRRERRNPPPVGSILFKQVKKQQPKEKREIPALVILGVSSNYENENEYKEEEEEDDDEEEENFSIGEWSEASFSQKQNRFQDKRKNAVAANSNNKKKSFLFLRIQLLFSKVWTILKHFWGRWQGRVLFVRGNKQQYYWYHFQKWIRSKVERYTIYVLECENGKYYVGSTQHKKQRLREHFAISSNNATKTKKNKKGNRGMPSSSSSAGVAWTRDNPPVRVLQLYTRVPPQYALGLESQVTAEAMLQYGVNNVRGACFSDPKPYSRPQHVDALTRFLGHYNNLNYDEVQDQLNQILPYHRQQQATTNILTKNKRRRKGGLSSSVTIGENDRCFHCGKRGHWAMTCPDRQQTSNAINNDDDKNPNETTLLNVNELSQFNGNTQKVFLPATQLDNHSNSNNALPNKKINPTDICFNCGQQGHWAQNCPN